MRMNRWAVATSAVLSMVFVLGCVGSIEFHFDEAPEQPAATRDAELAVVSAEVPAPAAPVPEVEAPTPPQPPAPVARAAAEAPGVREILGALEEALGDIYSSVLPSVVHVHTTVRLASPSSGGAFGTQIPLVPAEGSGFVWSKDGHVVTNAHVVEGAERVWVVFSDGSRHDATILGADPHSDLAVLLMESPPDDLEAVTLGDSDALTIGQTTVAIGSPFGQEFSMTTGIVSGLSRTIRSGTGNYSNPKIIQTDAPINPGNSGGPLLDWTGQVIGINTQIATRSGTNSGVGFAVPVNTAKRVVPELISNGSYRYAYLGISGASLTADLAAANSLPEDTRGVLVIGVAPNGPAEQFGLTGSAETEEIDGVTYPVGGDVITAIDGVSVDGMDDLVAHLVENNRPGQTVRLEILTSDGVRAADVMLGERPRNTTS